MPDLCQLCLGGPQAHKAPGYDLFVCKQCWQGAERGWDPGFEPTLMQALARRGLLIPDRNARGRLPRAYSPPADFAL